MTKKADLAIVIGRFNIFHKGHEMMIEEACKVADNVLILVGSVNRSRSFEHSFSYQEREEMIRSTLTGQQSYLVQIKPLNDYLYVEYQWESEVQRLGHDHAKKLGAESIVLVGHVKDNSSYYLKNFPNWSMHHVEQEIQLSASTVRDKYFNNCEMSELAEYVHPGVLDWLTTFRSEPAFVWLRKQLESIVEFRKPYESLPFGINFITGDSLVCCRGHILLVKRASFPGKDQWALPGGFKEQGEYARNCIIRELREETTINVPPRVLEQAYRGKKLFEDPKRDDRGDFSTHVGHFILTDTELPEVKTKNRPDAPEHELETAQAKWFPFAQVNRMSKAMFADHYFIIQNMLGSGYGTGFTN